MSAARDIVFVRGLRVDALIGVYAWERGLRQTLCIDLDMEHPIRAAGASDSLADALDYHAVCERVREVVQASSYQLIEALAEALAALLIGEFGVPWLRLRLVKPGAVPGAEEVGVLIERSTSR